MKISQNLTYALRTGNPKRMLLILAGIAGAVHVLAPDHWLPASVVAWQKGWRWGRSALFSGGVLILHILLGLSIFFAFNRVLGLGSESEDFLALALIGLVSVTVLRGIRFSRIREVLRAGPHSVWGIFAVISLLGPCESIIPIFIKARQLGMGYLTPFLAYLAGTLLTGLTFVLLTQGLWNHPRSLTLGIQWAHRRGATLPSIAALGVGLSVLWAV